MAVVSASEAKKYFSYPTFLKWFTYSILLFAASAYLATQQHIQNAWYGVVFFMLLALILFFTGMRDVPSDEDIEETYANYANKAVEKAINSLNLSRDDLVRETDWFWYASWGIKDYPKRYREGKDKEIRANTRSFLLILYAANQIMTYEVDYNIEANVESKANNSEWFYKDVVGVEVTTDDLFILRTSGGAKEFPLKKQGSDDVADEERARNVMNSIRSMLREKK